MIRNTIRSFSSDSPFRYKNTIRVSPHIRSKDFGYDVLLFASPAKLNKEALQIISAGSSAERSKGFWEIFAKRTNESIHLLDGGDICNILQAFNKSPSQELLAGICRVIADDIIYRPTVTARFSKVGEALVISQTLCDNLLSIETGLYMSLSEYFAGSTHLIDQPDDVKGVLTSLSTMRSRAKISSESPMESLLLKKLVMRFNKLVNSNLPADHLSFQSALELVEQV